MTYILMMNHLCVIARNPETYFMKRLTEEVGRPLVYNPWGESELPEARHYLIRTTGVYGDDRDLDLLRNSERNVINPVTAHELLRDKSRQFQYLERKGFYVIPWKNLDLRGEFLPEKILIKPVRGQGGWGIQVMNQKEFLQWEKETVDRSWIVQPYLEDVRELRLFYCGDFEVLLEREGHIASNFRQGGKAKVISIPHELSELGEEIRLITGTSYGAIDLFETREGHLILEVNPVPGVEQLEKLTGENIVRKVLSLFPG